IDCRHAVRTTLDHLTIFQASELAARARVEDSAGQNDFRRETNVFRFPFDLTVVAADGAHMAAARSVNECLVNHRSRFGEGLPTFIDTEFLARALFAAASIKRRRALVE